MRTSKILASLILLAGLVLASCSSDKTHVDTTPRPNRLHWGISIYSVDSILDKRGELLYRVHRISPNSLDGFWEYYSGDGQVYEVEFYLNHALDTSWCYNEGELSYVKFLYNNEVMYSYNPLDSLGLRKHLADARAAFNPAEGVQIKSSDTTFLAIPIEKAAFLVHKNGTPSISAHFVDEKLKSGFLMFHHGSAFTTTDFIVNQQRDTTFSYSDGMMAYEEYIEFEGENIPSRVQYDSLDAIRLMEHIQRQAKLVASQ